MLALGFLLVEGAVAAEPGDAPSKANAGAGSALGSSLRAVAVDYRKIESGQQGNGFAAAQIKVNYRFLICSDGVVIAYYFEPDSVVASQNYWASGNIIQSGVSKPRPTAVEFGGTVNLGAAIVGQFDDKSAGGTASRLDCSSRTQKVGNVSDYLGPKATAAQTQAFLDGLSLRPAPMSVALTDETLDRAGQSKSNDAGSKTISNATALNSAAAATSQAATAANAKAMQDYMDQLQQSRQAIADFKTKRAEYESELQAAKEARARYEQQFHPNQD
jgi:hypothetical protein